MPFEYVYVPMLHTLVAALSCGTGWSAARAYHFVVALGYCFGPVTLYVLARTLSASPATALVSGLLYTLFSPSLLFMADIRADSGAIFAGRRLRVLTVFGEGPHIAAMTLIPLALAAVYRCLFSFNVRRSAIAAIALAAVIMTNTPATLAMAAALGCLFFALPAVPLRAQFFRTAFVAIWAYSLAVYAVPPSYLKMIFKNLESTHVGFASGGQRWLLLAALLVFLFGLGKLLAPLPLYLRFAILYSLFLLAVVPGADSSHFELLPEAGRFHLELELALCLLIAGVLMSFHRSSKFVLILAGAAGLVFQFQSFRTRASYDLIPTKLESRSEYQSAHWLADNPAAWNGRVFAPGSNAFWLNVFTDIPQVTGCCDQGRSSPMPSKLATIVNLSETAEQRKTAILWLKAFGVGAFIAPGPQSTEEYKDFRNAQKFKEELPILHEGFGDIIYAVPHKAPHLVQILEKDQVLKNTSDSSAMEQYVEGASGSIPPTVKWNESQKATISAQLKETQVLSLKITSAPGWKAYVGGKRVPIEKDALDFMVIKPGCTAACEIDLQWSSPFPVWITAIISIAALLFCFISLGTFKRTP